MTVELLGGRGSELWPWPERIFAVGPTHTFGDFADTINDAFARWDRSHLSMFTLADGRVVTDGQTGADMTGASGGPVITAIDLASAHLARCAGGSVPRGEAALEPAKELLTVTHGLDGLATKHCAAPKGG